jgi:bifunctional DNA-binding transcriptional regulator/antitoxin component of YhaV-PrlF toxin-antitoxin module
MNTALMLSNGDLRLPVEVAQRLNLRPGDAVAIETDADGTVRLFPKALDPDEVLGFLSTRTSVVATIDEMDEAIAESFRKVDA